MMIDINDICTFISSDSYDGSSNLLNNLYDNTKNRRQYIILTNLEDDCLFASTYPEFNFIVCNKPGEDKIKLEDRFDCALNFIKINNIENYVLILDK